MKKQEKPYKRDDALTRQQEIFCEEIAKGETNTQAYFVAYPTSKNWTRQSVWVEASKLMKKEKIRNRVEELKEDTQEDVNWTRKRVLANLNYILDGTKGSTRRKKQIYDEMIDEKYEELIEWTNLLQVPQMDTKGVKGKIAKITKEIRQLELEKENIQPDTKGILSSLQIINRMQGYDLTKQEKQEEDNEREELKNNLTVEELRQLVYGKEEKE